MRDEIALRSRTRSGILPDLRTLLIGTALLLMPSELHSQLPGRSSEAPRAVAPTPGTAEARAALMEHRRLPGVEALGGPARRVQAQPQPSCTETALLVGALAAGAGLVLARLIDGSLQSDPAASDYLIAGGTMFAVGAGYAAIRCRVGS